MRRRIFSKDEYIELINSTSEITISYNEHSNILTIPANQLYRLNSKFLVTGYHMFKNCENLKYLNLSHCNLSNLDSLELFLSGCTSLNEVNLNSIDTSNVTNMSGMFNDCVELTSINLSCDASNVTNMSGMFCNCTNLMDLNLSFAPNTYNVTLMLYMFAHCEELRNTLTLPFNTSNVTDMGAMFSSCFKLKTLNLMTFTANHLESCQSMFVDCIGLETIYLNNFHVNDDFIIAPIGKIDGMFSGCTNLKTLYCPKTFYDILIYHDELCGLISSNAYNNGEFNWVDTE